MKRTGLALALTAAIAIGALTPATAQDMPFESKIRLKDSFPAFHGKVKSDSSQCIFDRKIRLFKVKSGEDKVLGKTRTDAEGRWEILMEPKSGVYYAKVNQFDDEATMLVCLPDKSKKVSID